MCVVVNKREIAECLGEEREREREREINEKEQTERQELRQCEGERDTHRQRENEVKESHNITNIFCNVIVCSQNSSQCVGVGLLYSQTGQRGEISACSVD